jgi:hypothetical protein
VPLIQLPRLPFFPFCFGSLLCLASNEIYCANQKRRQSDERRRRRERPGHRYIYEERASDPSHVKQFIKLVGMRKNWKAKSERIIIKHDSMLGAHIDEPTITSRPEKIACSSTRDEEKRCSDLGRRAHPPSRVNESFGTRMSAMSSN